MKKNSMHKKLVLITGNNGFFGQTRKPWTSMDADRIRNRLQENGFTVELYSYHEIVNGGKKVTDSIVFYAFSQKENVRHYVRDLIRFLDDGTNLVIPSYDFLKCHENKGYQELFKKHIGLDGLKSFYFSGREDMNGYDIEFPVVLKTIDGSNGKGVYLIRNREELDRRVRKLNLVSPWTRLDLFRRKYFRRKKAYPEYPGYSNRKDYEEYLVHVNIEKPFILQEFVPNLTYDYRVLVFPDRCFVTKRHINEGDFRASGAKRFDCHFEADPDMLNFAVNIYEKMNTPFLSMDICPYGNGFCLFEFQGLNFGINVYMKSSGYYQKGKQPGMWEFVNEKSGIDIEIADGLAKYIRGLKI